MISALQRLQPSTAICKSLPAYGSICRNMCTTAQRRRLLASACRDARLRGFVLIRRRVRGLGMLRRAELRMHRDALQSRARRTDADQPRAPAARWLRQAMLEKTIISGMPDCSAASTRSVTPQIRWPCCSEMAKGSCGMACLIVMAAGNVSRKCIGIHCGPRGSIPEPARQLAFARCLASVCGRNCRSMSCEAACMIVQELDPRTHLETSLHSEAEGRGICFFGDSKADSSSLRSSECQEWVIQYSLGAAIWKPTPSRRAATGVICHF